MQAVQILMTYRKGVVANVWIGASSKDKVGHACTYTSAGLGVVNSPVVVYKERQLTKEDSEYLDPTKHVLSSCIESNTCFIPLSSFSLCIKWHQGTTGTVSRTK